MLGDIFIRGEEGIRKVSCVRGSSSRGRRDLEMFQRHIFDKIPAEGMVRCAFRQIAQYAECFLQYYIESRCLVRVLVVYFIWILRMNLVSIALELYFFRGPLFQKGAKYHQKLTYFPLLFSMILELN